MIRTIALLAALVALQPVAARPDNLDALFPGCVRAANGVTAWRCTADAFKAELAEMNINGYPMDEDKPAPKHHGGHSKRVADR